MIINNIIIIGGTYIHNIAIHERPKQINFFFLYFKRSANDIKLLTRTDILDFVHVCHDSYVSHDIVIAVQ